MTATEQALRQASLPPSNEPTVQWLERHVDMSSATTDLPGKIRFDLFPASRAFFDHFDHPRLRKETIMKCSQSGATENTFMAVLRRVVDKPVSTMWVSSTAEKAREDVAKRFPPAIESCPPAAALAPREDDRENFTHRNIKFRSMNMMIRGASAVTGLRGDPVALLICDERADWRPGRIHKARQRLTTKTTPVEISIGAAGLKGDELHVDWMEGSQTFIHFNCLHCQHSQPFRFGRKKSVLFPQPRQLGGLVWDESDVTRPGGQWDFEEVKKTVRFQCEKCGHLYRNSDKPDLLKTAHEHHRNPKSLPENFSLAVTALLLPWPKRSWELIVEEFLKASEAVSFGDIEPLKTFVQETLGEPWELRSQNQAKSELLDRCGEYVMGEVWVDPSDHTKVEPGTYLLLTFDRQQFKLVYVVRQWRKTGDSRLVHCGEFPSYDELREFQLAEKIRDRAVFGDDGGLLAMGFRQACLRYGWNALKGEDFDHFTIAGEQAEKSYRQGYRETQFDPGVGTVNRGRAIMRAFLWSGPWYKDKLFNWFTLGRAAIWELPSDIPAEYIKQMSANEWREKRRSNGQVEGFWYEADTDDFADCELEQLVAADLTGLTRYAVKIENQNEKRKADQIETQTDDMGSGST